MTTAQTISTTTKSENAKMIGAISASLFGWSLDLFDLFILLYVAPVVVSMCLGAGHGMALMIERL